MNALKRESSGAGLKVTAWSAGKAGEQSKSDTNSAKIRECFIELYFLANENL